MRTQLFLALLLAACGASAPAESSPSAQPNRDVVAEAEPVAEVERVAEVEPVEAEDDNGMVCATDADCIVGGPDSCCASSGPSCAQAWSRTAHEAFRARCDAAPCDRVLNMVCTGEEVDREAVCLQARCQLRAVAR